ncbi:hypothetical protein UlMin_024453 [Ulmus minor]
MIARRSIHHSPQLGLILCMIALTAALICSSTTATCLENERKALLNFRQGLVDHSNLLFSWKNHTECCHWRGVKCNDHTGHVVMLDLRAFNLEGKIDVSSLLELWHLNYLDLSLNDFEIFELPSSIDSLSQLKHLKLASAKLVGSIPHQLGNLSYLQTLDLSRNYNLIVINLDWLSSLSSLRSLNLSYVDLSKAVSWPKSVSKLPSLLELQLRGNQLKGALPDVFTNIVSLDKLTTLDLSNNLFWGLLPDLKNFPSLKTLILDNNQLNGSIPESIEQLSTLERLSLFSNSFSGVLTEVHFANLSRLNHLDLSYNHLSLNFSSNWIPPFDQLKHLLLSSCNVGPAFPKWIQTLRNLTWLEIGEANISDSIPDWLWNLSTSLQHLSLSYNQLNGSIPESIGQLSTLEWLSLYSNSFSGVLTEVHFANLSRLNNLDLSYNHLSLNFSSNWIPPFDQLEYLSLSSCNVGPAFPKWIQTLRNLTLLEIREANISDSIPDCFSGSISSLCATRLSLIALDLSNNNLSGELPNCWMQLDNLFFLNLANNHFSGKLPASLGNSSRTNLILDLANNNFSGSILPIWNIIPQIQILNLRKNNFSGEIPSFQSCDNLQFLDLGDNKISGRIPECIGRQNPPTLVVLVLQSNEFYGSIPSSLCNLQSLQVLDLPKQRIGFCTTMLQQFDCYDIGQYVMWKGIDIEFGANLKYLRNIDLSSNRLSGEIPDSITLLKLNTLNLSRNRLTGSIPDNFNPRSQLESLDLSTNQLSGRIPASLSGLTSINKLNLSYNKLTGRIPSSTQLDGFDASVYLGNDDLCGPVLKKSCSGDDDKPDQVPHKTEGDADEDGFLRFGFYVSVAVGFVVGFWGACGSLIFQSSWRYSFFAFMTRINDQIYVATRVMKARSQRALGAGWYVVNS